MGRNQLVCVKDAHIERVAHLGYYTTLAMACIPTHADYQQDDILGDENDLVYAAAIDEDGSVVMAGAGADDFQVIKLDADGSFVWRFQVRPILPPLPPHDSLQHQLTGYSTIMRIRVCFVSDTPACFIHANIEHVSSFVSWNSPLFLSRVP